MLELWTIDNHPAAVANGKRVTRWSDKTYFDFQRLQAEREANRLNQIRPDRLVHIYVRKV